MPDTHTIILFLLRWIHFIAGIVWIGHLYFFNFTNAPFEKTMDGPTKKAVVPQLRGRALFWFRWGAMITFVSGAAYLLYHIFVETHRGFGYFSEPRGQWILFGGLLGTIMWFNVWFIIWPRQKKIIPGIATGNKPADFDALVAMAGKASRLNTYLSIPMLFGMGAGAGHFPTSNGMWTGVGMLVALALGVGTAWVLVNNTAGQVGKEFAPPPPPAAPK